MFFILACLFLARRYGTSAAPIASSLADPLAYDAPIFTRDECSNDCPCPGRSVWDILWSCLASTFAVTWVSVHPNTPFLEEKSWPLLKRRIFLMCLALLAPEVMIMWAFKQWRGAVMIRETINKASPKLCVQWTMTHAHFLQMGGFKVVYIKGNDFYCSSDFRYETNKKGIVVQESILHFSDLRELLEKQLIYFPDTTAKEIEDRSKGDALSKGVALLQITWFIIQLIARAQQHLTITEIELTTAALAGLNSIMYLFWWNKPLDVRCPIIIRTKKLERQLANGRNGENESQNTGGSGEDTHARWTFTRDEFRLRDYLRDSPAWVALDLAAKTLCPVWMRTIFSRFANFGQSITSVLAAHLRSLAKWLLKMIRVLLQLLPHRPETDDQTEVELQRSDDEREVESPNSTDDSEDSLVTRSHFRRAVRACTFVVTKLFYLPYLLMFLPMDQILDPEPWGFDFEDYSDAKNKMDNEPALQLLFDEDDMGGSCAAFGSIHCAAWHFDFPSHVERILWRTASLSIVGICLSIVGGIPIHNFLWDKWFESPNGSKANRFWENVKRGLETIPAIVYPLSRVSLLILALISLRNLPDSAFETVSWTMFIPHI